MPVSGAPASGRYVPKPPLENRKINPSRTEAVGGGRSGPRLELLASSGDTQTTRHTLLMKTLRRHVTFGHAILVLPALFLALSAASAASAGETPPPRTDATATRDADRTGQFCPISGCIPAEGRPFSHAIGFAVAIVGTFWFAGRRNPARG